MPTVPTVERQQTLAPLQAAPLPKPQGTFGAPLLEASGEALKIAKDQQEIMHLEEDRVNKAIILNADYELSKLKTNLEVTRGRYKGKDAHLALDDVQKAWESGVEEIGKTLGNDAQKASYLGRAQHHWLGAGGLYESTLKYVDKEIGQFEEDTYKSVIDLRIENAIQKSSDPEQFQQSVEEIKAITNDFYKENPALAASKFNDYVKDIDTGIKELNLEAERQKKRLAEEAQLNANNDLTDLFFNDALSYAEIKKRELELGKDYETWVKSLKADQKRKADELKTEIKDDPEFSANLSAEAMTLPADVTMDEINQFRKKVAQSVLDRKIKSTTGRSIISDAERTLQLDPVRKAAENDIIGLMKLNYNAGMYGEPGSDAGRREYLAQVDSFRKWTRANPGKEPSEYWDKVSDVTNKNFTTRLLSLVGMGPPEVTPAQRRTEIEQEGKRNKAIEILKSRKAPVTDANINFVMERM